MNRRPLNLLTALSLLMFLAVAALWVRSHWRFDLLLVRSVEPIPGAGFSVAQLSFSYRSGVLYFGRQRWGSDQAPGDGRGPVVLKSSPAVGGKWDAGFNPGNVRWHVGRLAWVDDVSRTHRASFLTVPAWLLAAVFAALPAARLHRRARARITHGQCSSCGYDLTGNVSGVCPECGTAP